MMAQALVKLGNSVGLRIPQGILKAAGMSLGQQVTLVAAEGKIEIKPATVTIEELFRDYTGDYHCSEIDWGNDVGREVF